MEAASHNRTKSIEDLLSSKSPPSSEALSSITKISTSTISSSSYEINETSSYISKESKQIFADSYKDVRSTNKEYKATSNLTNDTDTEPMKYTTDIFDRPLLSDESITHGDRGERLNSSSLLASFNARKTDPIANIDNKYGASRLYNKVEGEPTSSSSSSKYPTLMKDTYMDVTTATEERSNILLDKVNPVVTSEDRYSKTVISESSYESLKTKEESSITTSKYTTLNDNKKIESGPKIKNQRSFGSSDNFDRLKTTDKASVISQSAAEPIPKIENKYAGTDKYEKFDSVSTKTESSSILSSISKNVILNDETLSIKNKQRSPGLPENEEKPRHELARIFPANKTDFIESSANKSVGEKLFESFDSVSTKTESSSSKYTRLNDKYIDNISSIVTKQRSPRFSEYYDGLGTTSYSKYRPLHYNSMENVPVDTLKSSSKYSSLNDDDKTKANADVKDLQYYPRLSGYATLGYVYNLTTANERSSTSYTSTTESKTESISNTQIIGSTKNSLHQESVGLNDMFSRTVNTKALERENKSKPIQNEEYKPNFKVNSRIKLKLPRQTKHVYFKAANNYPRVTVRLANWEKVPESLETSLASTKSKIREKPSMVNVSNRLNTFQNTQSEVHGGKYKIHKITNRNSNAEWHKKSLVKFKGRLTIHVPIPNQNKGMVFPERNPALKTITRHTRAKNITVKRNKQARLTYAKSKPRVNIRITGASKAIPSHANKSPKLMVIYSNKNRTHSKSVDKSTFAINKQTIYTIRTSKVKTTNRKGMSWSTKPGKIFHIHKINEIKSETPTCRAYCKIPNDYAYTKDQSQYEDYKSPLSSERQEKTSFMDENCNNEATKSVIAYKHNIVDRVAKPSFQQYQPNNVPGEVRRTYCTIPSDFAYTNLNQQSKYLTKQQENTETRHNYKINKNSNSPKQTRRAYEKMQSKLTYTKRDQESTKYFHKSSSSTKSLMRILGNTYLQDQSKKHLTAGKTRLTDAKNKSHSRGRKTTPYQQKNKYPNISVKVSNRGMISAWTESAPASYVVKKISKKPNIRITNKGITTPSNIRSYKHTQVPNTQPKTMLRIRNNQRSKQIAQTYQQPNISNRLTKQIYKYRNTTETNNYSNREDRVRFTNNTCHIKNSYSKSFKDIPKTVIRITRTTAANSTASRTTTTTNSNRSDTSSRVFGTGSTRTTTSTRTSHTTSSSTTSNAAGHTSSSSTSSSNATGRGHSRQPDKPKPIQGGNSGQPAKPKPSEDTHPYTIKTFTGSSYWAGTDANVFITLYGSEGMSEEIHLIKSNDHKNPFERNNTDTFDVKSKDLGHLYKVNIRHDNTGRAPGWNLNKILVIDESGGQEYKFPCYQWLFKSSKSSEDYKTEHELEVDAFPIMSVDPLISENSKAHHTEKFKLEDVTLMLRRGQSFKLSLKLAREYRQDDDFYFTLKTGKRPSPKDKTLIAVTEVLPKNFDDLKNQEKWGYTIRDIEDPKNIIIEVFVPANALPAKYTCSIDSDDGTLYEPECPIYILFNPWCKEDEVYMEDEDQLREYVLRQSGQVYVGSYRNPRPRKWYYGQFEQVSLETAFNLLEGKKAQDRDTAIEVSRIVSSLVNSCDNNGVLEGNWSGDYEGGKSPTFWNSTPAILEVYMVDQLPVKFGQCWVFSSIVTTIMRALGIPCRSVTNFASAHDSDGNCSNDRYIDENGDNLDANDSVWNFHVWNDAWMARTDLPVGYGGWQAIDATPQEMSQGLFQMGPASLRAVKEGEIDLKYDTGFVLAEVNADTIYWKKNESGEFEAIKRNRTSVGKKLSTKEVNSDDRNDVTDSYKFAEGSILERGSVRNALVKTGNKAVKSTRQDIEMELVPEKDNVIIGDDVTLLVKLKNTSTEDLDVTLAVSGQILRYNGVGKAKLANYKERVVAKANSERDIPIRVKAYTYLADVKDDTMLRFIATASIAKTGQIVLAEEVIDLEKPSLELKDLPDKIPSLKEASFAVMFTNPLNKDLTGCELYVDGSIVKNRIWLKDIKDVAKNGKFYQTIKLTPDEVGGIKRKSIAVSFCCTELGGIQCNAKVQVED